jgi:hypothetical protein
MPQDLEAGDAAWREGALQCVQHPGDIMYIPMLLGHGVVRRCTLRARAAWHTGVRTHS